jgi:hypothetical protein
MKKGEDLRILGWGDSVVVLYEQPYDKNDSLLALDLDSVNSIYDSVKTMDSLDLGAIYTANKFNICNYANNSSNKKNVIFMVGGDAWKYYYDGDKHKPISPYSDTGIVHSKDWHNYQNYRQLITNDAFDAKVRFFLYR